MDRTVLLHQAAAAQSAEAAEILLLGDSSCMMDLQAGPLSQALPGQPSVLNLGAVSYLELPVMGEFAAKLATQQGRPPRVIVLMMHPETLRQGEFSPAYTQIAEDFYAGKDSTAGTRLWQRVVG